MALSERVGRARGLVALRPAARLAARALLSSDRPRQGRHPLAPAALRVERSRVRSDRGEAAEQTALTVWFGEGPQLPGPSLSGRVPRALARGALAAVAAAAFGAMAAIAAQRESASLQAREQYRRLAGHRRDQV